MSKVRITRVMKRFVDPMLVVIYEGRNQGSVFVSRRFDKSTLRETAWVWDIAIDVRDPGKWNGISDIRHGKAMRPGWE